MCERRLSGLDAGDAEAALPRDEPHHGDAEAEPHREPLRKRASVAEISEDDAREAMTPALGASADVGDEAAMASTGLSARHDRLDGAQGARRCADSDGLREWVLARADCRDCPDSLKLSSQQDLNTDDDDKSFWSEFWDSDEEWSGSEFDDTDDEATHSLYSRIAKAADRKKISHRGREVDDKELFADSDDCGAAGLGAVSAPVLGDDHVPFAGVALVGAPGRALRRRGTVPNP